MICFYCKRYFKFEEESLMELTYKFSRGSWKTLKEGQEREWLIGNRLGDFSATSRGCFIKK